MTIDTLAAYIQVSVSSIYKLVETSRVSGLEVGNHWQSRKEMIGVRNQEKSSESSL